MEQTTIVTLPSEGPTESVRGETVAKRPTTESKPRKRNLRLETIEAALLLLISLRSGRAPTIAEADRLRLYERDGF